MADPSLVSCSAFFYLILDERVFILFSFYKILLKQKKRPAAASLPNISLL